MIWQALTWPFIALFALAASWFGGRKSARAGIKLDAAEKNLATVLQAKEIENEVEALSTDDLKRRSRVWVRNPDR